MTPAPAPSRSPSGKSPRRKSVSFLPHTWPPGVTDGAVLTANCLLVFCAAATRSSSCPCAPLSPEHRWLPPTRAGPVHVADLARSLLPGGWMSASLLLPPGVPGPTQCAQYRNPTQPRAHVLSHVRPTPGAESPRASYSKRGRRSTTPAQKLRPPRSRRPEPPTGSR